MMAENLKNGTGSMSLDQHTVEALDQMSAYERVAHAHNQYGTGLVMSTSFGIQRRSTVMLHLVKQQLSQIPIIFIDTGYLFPETYAAKNANRPTRIKH